MFFPDDAVRVAALSEYVLRSKPAQREVAEQIGVSTEFVRSEIKAGRLKASKTKDSGEAGGAVFILVEDVYSWLRERSESQS
jgi:hypothetical protein